MNSDVAKTLNYIKKNGPVKTYYAIRERLEDRKQPYEYIPISEEQRLIQISDSLSMDVSFSILVPAYETNPQFMREMIDSVRLQTYSKWQLVIADASESNLVKDVVDTYSDQRIVYVRLNKNLGISGNSNAGLEYLEGDYTGLLDHDDILTQDALFEMAKTITKAREKGISLKMVYSDEDKTNGDGTAFSQPNIKPKFNLDLILSNNYICHFLVIETGLLKETGFDDNYDGAQDHNLVLSVITSILDQGSQPCEFIAHTAKVLYHWRCHDESTAANPKSKLYAYQAGKRAVENFLSRVKFNANVTDLPHMGFFYVNYEPDIFSVRPNVIARCGRIIHKGKVVGGIYDENRKMMFEGCSVHSSGGYLHRAACQMEALYADISALDLSKTGQEKLDNFLKSHSEQNRDIDDNMARNLSFEFCELMRSEGYTFSYDPALVFKV